MTQQRKSIFITGGGSGIGRAIALLFSQRGWFVGVGDVNAHGLGETIELLASGFAYQHVLDVTDRAEWDHALQVFATAAGGRIDAVVNNAGLPLGGPLAELSQAEIDRVLDVNLKGVIYGAQAAYPHLKASAPGSALLNIASAAALYGVPNQSIYGATKAGVRSLTETLDAEWHADGIRVRALLPSWIDTPLLANAPNRSRNVPIRDTVVAAGFGFTPVEEVAEEAWNAVHGERLHTMVGAVAKQMRLAAKWAPGYLRKRARRLAEAYDEVHGVAKE
jgi:NAD(P)-dependent dehydrogenase (short-subunit alcohol dehydrogenase family)